MKFSIITQLLLVCLLVVQPMIQAFSKTSTSIILQSLYRPKSHVTVNSKASVFRSNTFRYVSTSSTAQNDLKSLQPFLNEIIEILRTTGLRVGVSRSIQVAQAINTVTRQYLSNPKLFTDPKTDQISLPKTLRRLFEELGATYIKLGQFIASSPTLFPAEFVLEFQSCLDKTPTIPFYEINKIVKRELGTRSIPQVFSYIDPVPLACASIAQVHRGILKETGQEVVLKVRKPGVDSTLKADLGFLYIAVKIIELINPSLSRVSLANIVGDIRQSMLDELDFRKEAKNLDNFREFLERNEITDALAPTPIPQLTSEKLLVMDYLKGVPLLDLDGIRKYSANPEQTLISAMRTWASSVIDNDSFHADLHGGNLLVLEDGRVGFLDFGIVGKISDTVWKALQLLTKSFAKGDYQGVAEALVSMGATDGKVDIDKFAVEIEEVFERIINIQPMITIESTAYGSRVDATVDEKETTELALQVIEVADKNGLQLPREFGLLLKQTLYFDRYQKLLAPNLDPLRDSRMRQALSGDDEELPQRSSRVIDV